MLLVAVLECFALPASGGKPKMALAFAKAAFFAALACFALAASGGKVGDDMLGVFRARGVRRQILKL